MKETYVPYRFKSKHRALLAHVAAIFDNYAAQGFDLTVRQLHYQLVSRNLVENTLKNYKMLVGLVTNARLGGYLDWGSMVDRTRGARRNSSWDSVHEFLTDIANEFQLDKWADQDDYFEVMMEKDALSGVIGPVCSELDIAVTANKGYSSSSAMYKAAKRLRSYADQGKTVHVLYLGDHDPSGMDMTRDIGERLTLLGGDPVEDGGPSPMDLDVIRIALNIDQVKKLNPPENFAKDADSRTPKYTEEFGEHCWELDAVEPLALATMIRKRVLKSRDEEKWDAALKKEAELVDHLKKFAAGVQGYAAKGDPEDTFKRELRIFTQLTKTAKGFGKRK